MKVVKLVTQDAESITSGVGFVQQVDMSINTNDTVLTIGIYGISTTGGSLLDVELSLYDSSSFIDLRCRQTAHDTEDYYNMISTWVTSGWTMELWTKIV